MGKVPWWKPELDADGRLVTTRKPVSGIRLLLTEAGRALIAVSLVGGIAQWLTHNAVVTGVVAWAVLLGWIALRRVSPSPWGKQD